MYYRQIGAEKDPDNVPKGLFWGVNTISFQTGKNMCHGIDLYALPALGQPVYWTGCPGCTLFAPLAAILRIATWGVGKIPPYAYGWIRLRILASCIGRAPTPIYPIKGWVLPSPVSQSLALESSTSQNLVVTDPGLRLASSPPWQVNCRALVSLFHLHYSHRMITCCIITRRVVGPKHD